MTASFPLAPLILLAAVLLASCGSSSRPAPADAPPPPAVEFCGVHHQRMERQEETTFDPFLTEGSPVYFRKKTKRFPHDGFRSAGCSYLPPEKIPVCPACRQAGRKELRRIGLLE